MSVASLRVRVPAGALGIVLGLAAGVVPADDLRGADRFLCSTLHATVCFVDGSCLATPVEALNIPRFIVVDVKAGKLETTEASGERRETRADTVSRAEERVKLQGHEAGRAFSLLINETTGLATFTSAADERASVVFAACTPAPRK